MELALYGLIKMFSYYTLRYHALYGLAIFLYNPYMDSDFSSFLGRSRFDFGVNVAFINVHSIENYYFKMHGHRNQRAVFANWLNDNQLAVCSVFDHLLSARDLDISLVKRDITIEQKIKHIVCRQINTAMTVHPLIAIVFAISISNEFRVFIISRIAGMMNTQLVNSYISTMEINHQSNLQWQSIVHDKDIEIIHLKRAIHLCNQQNNNMEREISTYKTRHVSCFKRVLTFLKMTSSARNKTDTCDYVQFEASAS
jgi:hypothetical protein